MFSLGDSLLENRLYWMSWRSRKEIFILHVSELQFSRVLQKGYILGRLDRISSKFASWKDMLVTMAGRVQLVKSVIQGVMVYTMKIYLWPKQLLRKLESFINNFIWTGDIHKRGAVTVKWKLICKPVEEGLGIKSLCEFNEACMSVLLVNFLQGTKI